MDEFDKARIGLMRERIALLQERLRLKDAQIETLQWDVDRLKAALTNPPRPSATPLWVSEDEEDIEFAKQAQVISIREAEDMLSELGFDNAEIDVDDPISDTSLF